MSMFDQVFGPVEYPSRGSLRCKCGGSMEIRALTNTEATEMRAEFFKAHEGCNARSCSDNEPISADLGTK